jgi:hypothetical protein
MNTRFLNCRLPLRGGVLALFLAVLFPALPATAQTNLSTSGSTLTNSFPYRLPTPTDFQRLQYYYASYPSSPAPGAEHAIFTVGTGNTWNGSWSSSVVPAPSRSQLNAITAPQVDIFRRAAVFTNGTWQIVTPGTNTPLSSLNLTPSSYMQIRQQLQPSSTITTGSLTP